MAFALLSRHSDTIPEASEAAIFLSGLAFTFPWPYLLLLLPHCLRQTNDQALYIWIYIYIGIYIYIRIIIVSSPQPLLLTSQTFFALSELSNNPFIFTRSSSICVHPHSFLSAFSSRQPVVVMVKGGRGLFPGDRRPYFWGIDLTIVIGFWRFPKSVSLWRVGPHAPNCLLHCFCCFF